MGSMERDDRRVGVLRRNHVRQRVGRIGEDPGLETPVLIVLDQAVIRVAGKGEWVEPEGVDRGLYDELQTGA